jgi:hypothetical protein
MILVQITTHISEYGQFIESVFDEAINYYASILAGQNYTPHTKKTVLGGPIRFQGVCSASMLISPVVVLRPT